MLRQLLQLLNAPVLPSVSICHLRLWQEQRKAVWPLTSSLLQAVIEVDINRHVLYLQGKIINKDFLYSSLLEFLQATLSKLFNPANQAGENRESQEQLDGTYHISVFVFREVQVKLHGNKFLFFQDELKKTDIIF